VKEKCSAENWLLRYKSSASKDSLATCRLLIALSLGLTDKNTAFNNYHKSMAKLLKLQTLNLQPNPSKP